MRVNQIRGHNTWLSILLYFSIKWISFWKSNQVSCPPKCCVTQNGRNVWCDEILLQGRLNRFQQFFIIQRLMKKSHCSRPHRSHAALSIIIGSIVAISLMTSGRYRFQLILFSAAILISQFFPGVSALLDMWSSNKAINFNWLHNFPVLNAL